MPLFHLPFPMASPRKYDVVMLAGGEEVARDTLLARRVVRQAENG